MRERTSASAKLAASVVALLGVLLVATFGVAVGRADTTASTSSTSPTASADEHSAGADALIVTTTAAAPATTTTTTTVAPPTTTTPKPAVTGPPPAPVRASVVAALDEEPTPGPARGPASAREPSPAPPPASSGAADRCAAARTWLAGKGLVLPPGFEFRCPGQALDSEGHPHWGISCYNCGQGTNYVAIDVGRIGSSDATLRYVVAHEICHSVESVLTGGITTEAAADTCAALFGAPRP